MSAKLDILSFDCMSVIYPMTAHDHQVNGFSDIEHPSLVAAFMNGAAIAPHDNVPLPFPIPTFGPNPQQSSSEGMYKNYANSAIMIVR